MTQLAIKTGHRPVSIHKNDPFRFVCDNLAYYSHSDMKKLARAAGVCVGTLYNWYGGRVESPHLRTVTGVVEAMGYRLVVK